MSHYREVTFVVVKRKPMGAVPYTFYEVFKKFVTGIFLPMP